MRLGARLPTAAIILTMSATNPPLPLANFIRERNIEATFVPTPSETPTDTAADAAAALGLDDASRVIKSLVFVATNGVPVLVLATGTLRIDRKAVEAAFGYRVRLATPAEAEAATGHEVGAIPPLCVSKAGTLRVFMDEGVLAHGEGMLAPRRYGFPPAR